MPTNADTWWNAALEELHVAHDLKTGGRGRQAFHHAGQAVEFALKAIYLRRHNLQVLPDEYKSAKGHDLKLLAKAAKLDGDIANFNKARRRNWLAIRNWDSNARFPDNSQPTKAVNDLFLALDRKGDGIWEWLESIYHQS